MHVLRKLLYCPKFISLPLHQRYKSTIFALSSGQGKCGVSIIRISGSNAKAALESMAGFSKPPQPRYAFLRSLRNPQSGVIIDKGLVLWFPGPRSFTGEDTCEFQIHGGLAVVNGILESLSTINSYRIAEPGEFTKRAFENGVLDLTEVEGLADLLNAETEIQRKQAFLQAQGFLSKLYYKWKDGISQNLAHLEALIDFGETEELDSSQEKEIFNSVTKLKNEIATHLLHGRKGETLRHGIKTVILGQPNVGKSSLLNLLYGRPAAIVTPISGTTRDVLEVRLDISGYPMILVDTAGIRESSPDPIEREGIKRAKQQLDEADLIIIVMDAVEFCHWKTKNQNLTFDDYLKQYLMKLGIENELASKPKIFVMNKIDLNAVVIEETVVPISCQTRKGIEDLIGQITQTLKIICGEPSKEHPSMSNARHRQHLEDCLSELNKFLVRIKCNSNEEIDVVILAEHLRRASRHLGKLVGTITTDQLLDIIFKDFCIGK
ncbi:hypothetical protein HHI36_022819 [Cryptolaemus montrouzieri]|uniref:TrmE-type G domain-containing protein n=1 Tax=Cryptolaemus montrouzieri TaxID=559131 RepID=A0ABD2PF34_9CUCU